MTDEPSVQRTSVSRTRVVIAEDDAATRQVLEFLFRARGIDVVAVARDGPAAVEAVERTSADVLVLDLDLPHMSGGQVAERVRAVAPEVRIVVYSATEVRDGALDVDAVVPKAAPLDELVDAVLLSRARRGDAGEA